MWTPPSSTIRRASAAYSAGVYGIAGQWSRFATAPEIEQQMITGSSRAIARAHRNRSSAHCLGRPLAVRTGVGPAQSNPLLGGAEHRRPECGGEGQRDEQRNLILLDLAPEDFATGADPIRDGVGMHADALGRGDAAAVFLEVEEQGCSQTGTLVVVPGELPEMLAYESAGPVRIAGEQRREFNRMEGYDRAGTPPARDRDLCRIHRVAVCPPKAGQPLAGSTQRDRDAVEIGTSRQRVHRLPRWLGVASQPRPHRAAVGGEHERSTRLQVSRGRG